MKLKVRTLFDITNTGVTGHYKSARAQYSTQEAWDRARNQQRNFETLQQILSLRTNLAEITRPIEHNGVWEFEFEVESDGVYGTPDDPIGILRGDAVGVPMLRELNNDPDVDTILIVGGPRQNVWFELVTINNTLEN
jgi:hypothetical protein